jgi:hypothetical protein
MFSIASKIPTSKFRRSLADIRKHETCTPTETLCLLKFSHALLFALYIKKKRKESCSPLVLGKLILLTNERVLR